MAKIKNANKEEKVAVEVKAPMVITPAVNMPAAAPTVPFEAWWASRKSRIPAHHHKEIIKADFKSRKVGDKATMKDYDGALGAYGVALK